MHTHVHSHLGHFRLAWFWEVEGKQRIWRQPTQTKREHVKLIRWQSQSPHWKRTPNHAALRFRAEALRFLTRNFTVIVTFMWSLGKLRGIYSYYNANYRRVTGKGKINIKFLCKLFSAHCYYTFHCTLAPILQANPIGASKMPPTALKKKETREHLSAEDLLRTWWSMTHLWVLQHRTLKCESVYCTATQL